MLSYSKQCLIPHYTLTNQILPLTGVFFDHIWDGGEEVGVRVLWVSVGVWLGWGFGGVAGVGVWGGGGGGRGGWAMVLVVDGGLYYG